MLYKQAAFMLQYKKAAREKHQPVNNVSNNNINIKYMLSSFHWCLYVYDTMSTVSCMSCFVIMFYYIMFMYVSIVLPDYII